MKTPRCEHGFSEPGLCPVCLHFDKIAQAEAQGQAAQERAAVAPPAAAEPSEGLGG
jgi:hypothetical protein